MAIFYFALRAPKLRYYGGYTLILLEISRRTRWWCLKCVIVYLARDIPPFVMNVLRQWKTSLILLKTEKTFKNEQRSKDAAAKKDLIQVE